MAKSKSEKLLKSKLIQEIEDVLQDVNLLLSALKQHTNPTQEELQNYKDRFDALMEREK